MPFVVLWIALGGLTLQAAGTARLLDGWLLFAFASIGLLAGWLLARTRARDAHAVVALTFFGAVLVVGRIGGLDARLAAVVVQTSSAHASQMIPGALAPAGVPVALLDLFGALASLLNRLFLWAVDSVSGRAVVDPVALNAAWGCGLLACGAWAGWIQRRHGNTAAALSPVLVSSALLAKASASYPAVVLLELCALLVLLAYGAHADRELRWERTGTDYSEDIRLDLGIAAALLITFVMTMAAVVPAIGWNDVISSTRSLFERIAFVRAATGAAEGAAPASAAGGALVPLPFETLRATGLPRQHLIASGAELSREVVMRIRILEAPPGASARPYWRGLTFDQYTGHGWVSSRVDATAYRAGDSLYDSEASDRLTWRQEVTTVVDLSGVIYAPGELNSVNQPFSVGRRGPDDFFGALTLPSAYTAQSLAVTAGEAVLEGSSGEYPDWVRARYFEVPAEVPGRVIALARELTATAPNPYARARAIESYLRGYTYTLDLPAPPINRDIVDYFLFDLRRGYCDYYASAMVVLARAAGLPARLAVGYAPGSYDPDTKSYTVTAADAHSWPEIYFSGVGWLAFEPTAGRPPLAREPGAGPAAARTAPSLVIPLGNIEAILWLTAQVIAASAGLCLAGAFTWLLSDDWRLLRMPPRIRLAALYGHLRAAGRALRVATRESDTPYEFGDYMEERLERLHLGDEAIVVQRLIADYVEAVYSAHIPADSPQYSAWPLRMLVWRARYRFRLEEIRKAFHSRLER